MDSFLQELFLGSVFDKFAYNLEIRDISWFEAFRIVQYEILVLR